MSTVGCKLFLNVQKVGKKRGKSIKCDEVDKATCKVWYFIKSHAHHYTEIFGKKMVEVCVDMFVEYKDFTCSPFGGNLIICLPPVSKLIIDFGQDEVIFRSSQINTHLWGIYENQNMRSKAYGSGKMVNGLQSREFGFGMDISKYD